MSNFLYNFKSNVPGLTLEGEILHNGNFLRGIKDGIEFTAVLKIKNFTSQHRDIQFLAQTVVSKDGYSTTSSGGSDRVYVTPGSTTEASFTCKLDPSFGSASNEFVEIVILDMLNFTLPAPILKIHQERLLKLSNPIMTGFDVECVQQRLNELGLISDNLTSYYDQSTIQAVKTFQSNKGLSVDGVIGANTWSSLFNTSSTTPPDTNDPGLINVDSGNPNGEARSGTENSIYDLSNGGCVKMDTTELSNYIQKYKSLPGCSLLSTDVILFVMAYEAFYEHHYICPAGKDTIGFGSIDGWIMQETIVTVDQAVKAFMEEFGAKALTVKADLDSKNINLLQREFDAIMSFAYNCGVSALLEEASFYKIICGTKSGDLLYWWKQWCKDDDKEILDGLLFRRVEEYDLYMYGDYKRDL